MNDKASKSYDYRLVRYISSALIVLLAAMNVNGSLKNRRNPRISDDDLLRAAIAHELGDFKGELRYISKRFDLNGDGRPEVIVWIPTLNLGGTSGYPLLIFSRDKGGYRLLWSFDQAWTPLIVLNSSQHGWRDVVFQMGGGGVEMSYVLIRHNGKSYSDNFRPIKTNRVRGHWLIGKDWKMSVMGPLPQQ